MDSVVNEHGHHGGERQNNLLAQMKKSPPQWAGKLAEESSGAGSAADVGAVGLQHVLAADAEDVGQVVRF